MRHTLQAFELAHLEASLVSMILFSRVETMLIDGSDVIGDCSGAREGGVSLNICLVIESKEDRDLLRLLGCLSDAKCGVGRKRRPDWMFWGLIYVSPEVCQSRVDRSQPNRFLH